MATQPTNTAPRRPQFLDNLVPLDLPRALHHNRAGMIGFIGLVICAVRI
jgi:hypothetical protein